ncbi:MAG: hypothetical protein WB588_00845 [Dehalococcoidia bacterium]
MEEMLRTALRNKEKAEVFLSNLEKLRGDGAVNDVSYNALKMEYASNLQHELSKIELIRQDLNKKINMKSTELSVYKQELANLDARFKVGQLSAAAYLKLSKNPDKKAVEVEEQITHFTSLLNAQRSNDVTVPEATGLKALVSFVSSFSGKPAGAQLGIPSRISAPSPQMPVKEELVRDATAVTNLQILPDRVRPGSTVGVVATLVNPGPDPVTHKAEFKVNQRLEAINDVALNPGQSQEITFMVVAGAPGDYYVSVDNANGIFRVMTGA